MNRLRVLAAAALVSLALPATAAEAPLSKLMRFPDVHGDSIVFSHAGDLWSVPVAGGLARRLTTGEGLELFPRFSNDGKMIAFTGQYDGTNDVYVIGADGGEPKRLTWYPSRDNNERMGWDNMVITWTPDGKVLYRSQRGAFGGFIGQPWTVSAGGGPSERFPLPETGILAFSPDGKRIAYNRNFRDFRTWKRYQGGQAPDVWIYDLEKKTSERITDWPGTDSQPMWIGDAIYFVSDRENWKLNLWRYDLKTKQSRRVTSFSEFDVKWPHAGPGPDGKGKIVFENGGELWIFDPETEKSSLVPVRIPDDEKLARRRWINVGDRIEDYAVSPGGTRASFSARGEVFTVPGEKGITHNITRSQGVRERSANWSADGKWISYISDKSGEEEIWIAPQNGKGAPQQITSGSGSWHFQPVWSPDSKKIAWADRAMHLWYVDITEKKPVRVTTATIWEITEYSWSPDSKWIGFTQQTENDFTEIFLYSLDTKSITQATRDFERSSQPVFDPEGKYLYFLSDRDIRPTLGNFESSYVVNDLTRPHVLTLRADLPSPFFPKNDEVGEESKDEKKDEKKDDKKDEKKDDKAKKPDAVKIDLAGIQDRVVAFPVSPASYDNLHAIKGKVLWMVSETTAMGEDRKTPSLKIFDMEKRKEAEALAKVDGYDLAPDNSKIIFSQSHVYYIGEPREGMKTDEGKLDISGLRMELDPKAEWAQIFDESWRVERDFFYLPGMGKMDWPAVRTRYRALLPYVSHRSDLTYVLSEMASELGSGHSYVGGGDMPHPENRSGVGLLGCDFAADAASKRWKIARIIPGQNWNDARRSPLTDPGLKVSEGDFLLAVDGREVTTAEEPYAAFANTAGKTVALTVNGKPSREGSREILVQTLASEADLRYYDWVETNRKKVEKASGGKIGYLHIPDMGGKGLTEFIRQFYPQIRKEGLVVDVRANGGGFVSQMILERLRRRPIGMGAARNARSGPYPNAAFIGPMVCLLNRYSASDGDIFPYMFREYQLGPLIGMRSWGGTVGIRGLGGNIVDGGYLEVPEFGVYSLKSKWVMENYGVPPDIEVDNLPQDEMAGKDAQLERAIAEVQKAMEAKKPAWPPRPPEPDLAKPKVRDGVEVP